jgi:hypothetical protein
MSIYATAVIVFSACDGLMDDGVEPQIESFSITGIVGDAEIDPEAKTVTATVQPMDLTVVEPTVGVSEGATVTSATLVDGESATFKVTGEDGTVVNWSVTVYVQRGISFTYESTPTQVVLTESFTDSADENHNTAIGNGVPLAIYGTSYEEAQVYALKNEIDVQTEPTEYEWASLYIPNETGTYDSTEVIFGYLKESENDSEDLSLSADETDAESFEVVVESFGDVGDNVVGTFSGTAEDPDNASHTITGGFFKVLRLEDDVAVFGS